MVSSAIGMRGVSRRSGFMAFSGWAPVLFYKSWLQKSMPPRAPGAAAAPVPSSPLLSSRFPMDVSYLLNELNDAQRDAVAAPPGPLLVLAGAGSGKTRVLTHRVAWLVGVEGQSPHAIMAVTFTNKAAAEMRSRIEQMLRTP